MHWMFVPYKRMLDFHGRSRRLEYWMFQLCLMIQLIVLGILFAVMDAGDAWRRGTGGPGMIAFFVLAAILALAFVWSHLAVIVRRFHDQDKSGWFFLLTFVPYAGNIILWVFMCLRGTEGPNRFGPDPLNPYMIDVFA